MQLFIQQLVNGLSIGAVYALIALGYTMVYGILRLINFAHGDVYMVGAVIAYALANLFTRLGMPAWLNLTLIFIGAAAGCVVLGLIIERFAYRPLRNRPRLVSLITAIGVSLFLENFFQQRSIFGAAPRQFPQLIDNQTPISIPLGHGLVVQVTKLDVINFTLVVVMMLVLSWIVLKTRTGLALRAVSYRFDTAALMGINIDRIVAFTFALGSGLAAIAGVMDGIKYQVDPLMGLMTGLKAFVAAVIGGIGSIPGAVLGGLLMGVIESLLSGVILPPAYSGYAQGAAFLALILILLVRPSGILGKYVPEKV